MLLCDFYSIQVIRRTIESEVIKYIPPGSLPGCLSPCLKRSIALRVRARESRLEAVLYPPRALPRALPQPQSCIRHPDITWSLYPDFPQTHGSTRNLSVYANLRTVQAHLHRALHGSAPPYLASSFTTPEVHNITYRNVVREGPSHGQR